MKKILSIGLLTVIMLANTNVARAELLAKDLDKTYTPSELLADGKDGRTAKDGTYVRKGTIKATIDNIVVLNNMFKQPSSPDRYEKITTSLKPIVDLIPALNALDLFKFFTVSEWLQDEHNTGRNLVTVLYLEKYMNQLDAQEKNAVIVRLKYLQTTNAAPELKDRIAALLKQL